MGKIIQSIYASKLKMNLEVAVNEAQHRKGGNNYTKLTAQLICLLQGLNISRSFHKPYLQVTLRWFLLGSLSVNVGKYVMKSTLIGVL